MNKDFRKWEKSLGSQGWTWKTVRSYYQSSLHTWFVICMLGLFTLYTY